MTLQDNALAAYDDRPFFARALEYGLKNGIISSEKLDGIRGDGPKGIVQIADFFGTAHLRTDLDEALKRMVYLASLSLEDYSDGHLHKAAHSLQENTFLSHSRGGSGMLKDVHAMPVDSTILDEVDAHEVKEFLRLRTLAEPWTVAEYRARRAERQAHVDEINAALWFAGSLGLERDALGGESADSVLDACLLTRIAGRLDGGLLDARQLKAFLKAVRKAKKKPVIRKTLLEDVPDEHRAMVERRLKKVVSRDLKRMVDPAVPFDDLVREYHDRFHSFSLQADVVEYEELLTDEWRKVTRGMSDTDSMNTIFLCLCAGKAPKPVISPTEAKTAIRTIRKDGVPPGVVTDFIERCAPHQMVDGLLSLWEDEFRPEVLEDHILRDKDDALEPTLRMLTQHCHISIPARKT